MDTMEVGGERCWTSIDAQMETIEDGGERWYWNGHSLGRDEWRTSGGARIEGTSYRSFEVALMKMSKSCDSRIDRGNFLANTVPCQRKGTGMTRDGYSTGQTI